MDTHEYIEIQRHLDQGKSPTDEGPYYHHAWWESYKGGVKGKFGGLIIGAVIGAAVGALVVGAAALASGTLIGISVGLPLVGSFAAAGLLYGAHEFGEVGKITGATAAVQQQAELRMKAFEEGKFAEVKQEIHKLKSELTGKPIDPKEKQEIQKIVKDYDDMDYRKTHYAKLKPVPMNTLAFWKVSLIGLVVGAVAGVMLGETHIALELFSNVTKHLGENAMGAFIAEHTTAISALVFGAMGASFGLNRDFFRRVFDKTDLWFKGLLHPKHHAKVHAQQVETGKDIEQEMAHIVEEKKMATAVMPEGYIDYPTSSTYHRDKVLAAAEKALLSFDHTRATPQ